MKKIAIYIIILGLALSYSCKKDRVLSTNISGQLRTNGTEEPIKMSVELQRPTVILYERTDQVGYTGSGYREFAKTTVDEYGKFSFQEDLKNNELYFLGVEGLDTSIYWELDHYGWWNMAYNGDMNVIDPGKDNSKILYISAKSWIRPRFINTNPKSNNNDYFKYLGGLSTIFSIIDTSYNPINGIYFIGPVDSLLSTIHKTWSGQYATGYADGIWQRYHHVEGKLTRNGITRDTNIFYFVPPFDTTIVEIRY
jgi:hypothetical protein